MRGKMMCPKYCKVCLEPVKVNDVEVDQCPKCEGVWFDSRKTDELIAILRQGYDHLPPRLQKSWHKGGGRMTPMALARYFCPRCGAELATYWYRPEEGRVFQVDGCRINGCGFWLDDGELGLAHELLSFVAPEELAPEESESIIERLLKFLGGR